MAQKPDKTLHVDILNTELEGKLPHWLSPAQRVNREAIRAKHRAEHFANTPRKPVSPETAAKLNAAYESAKAKDPAFFQETLDEVRAFNRHRGRPLVPPIADSEGALEARAWSRHRAGQRSYVIFVNGDDVQVVADDGPEDLPEKLQLVAWAKAIIVLDKSEIMVRDLIERELAGAHVMPIARILVITGRLTRKIKVIRESAIKLAFRLLRDRLGDKPILDHSLAMWAKTFADKDATLIKQAIVSGLSDGLDSTEIARKVVGTMGLNGVDGVTEATRLHVAHLGRAAIKESRLRSSGRP